MQRPSSHSPFELQSVRSAHTETQRRSSFNFKLDDTRLTGRWRWRRCRRGRRRAGHGAHFALAIVAARRTKMMTSSFETTRPVFANHCCLLLQPRATLLALVASHCNADTLTSTRTASVGVWHRNWKRHRRAVGRAQTRWSTNETRERDARAIVDYATHYGTADSPAVRTRSCTRWSHTTVALISEWFEQTASFHLTCAAALLVAAHAADARHAAGARRSRARHRHRIDASAVRAHLSRHAAVLTSIVPAQTDRALSVMMAETRNRNNRLCGGTDKRSRLASVGARTALRRADRHDADRRADARRLTLARGIAISRRIPAVRFALVCVVVVF